MRSNMSRVGSVASVFRRLLSRDRGEPLAQSPTHDGPPIGNFENCKDFHNEALNANAEFSKFQEAGPEATLI